MKKTVLCIVLLVGLSMAQSNYGTIHKFINNTETKIKISLSYKSPACEDEKFTLAPHKSKEIEVGLCCLSTISINNETHNYSTKQCGKIDFVISPDNNGKKYNISTLKEENNDHK